MQIKRIEDFKVNNWIFSPRYYYCFKITNIDNNKITLFHKYANSGSFRYLGVYDLKDFIHPTDEYILLGPIISYILNKYYAKTL